MVLYSALVPVLVKIFKITRSNVLETFREGIHKTKLRSLFSLILGMGYIMPQCLGEF